MLPPLEDSTWSSMGTSEQTDDAGEAGTSMLTSETAPRFLLLQLLLLLLLLLLLFIWRVDFAAVSFLQNHKMPKQRRQAKSSRSGTHHHVKACS